MYKYINKTTGDVISSSVYEDLSYSAQTKYARFEEGNTTQEDLISLGVSAAIAYATDSALLGGLLGGSLLGGIVGDLFDGDLFD